MLRGDSRREPRVRMSGVAALPVTARLTYEQHLSFAVWLGTRGAEHPCPVCDDVRWMVRGRVADSRSVVHVRCAECTFERSFGTGEVGLAGTASPTA